jgi:excinuclease ABC subunit C
MMMEVVYRRFKRGQAEGNMPDLLVVDGGKGQLNAACTALSELGVVGVDVIGLAKSRVLDGETTSVPEHSAERVFLPGRKNPVILRQNSAELYLLTRLRDEAHRFAITYHRKLRSKRTITSALDTIAGIGPSRKRALLRSFGSLRKLKEAPVKDITAIPGITEALAESILETLNGGKNDTP